MKMNTVVYKLWFSRLRYHKPSRRLLISWRGKKQRMQRDEGLPIRQRAICSVYRVRHRFEQDRTYEVRVGIKKRLRKCLKMRYIGRN